LNCFKETAAAPEDDGTSRVLPRTGARVVESPDETTDLRALEPPEPLLRILERLDADAGNGPHVFLLAREPVLLYPLLVAGHWRHATRVDERGCVLTVYRKR